MKMRSSLPFWLNDFDAIRTAMHAVPRLCVDRATVEARRRIVRLGTKRIDFCRSDPDKANDRPAWIWSPYYANSGTSGPRLLLRWSRTAVTSR